jgi:two-component system NarL family response regulator
MKTAAAPFRDKPISVVIADDHPVVREGIASLIKSQPDMKLLGEAENGQTAIKQFFRLHPDVTLLDLRMPVVDGIAATRAILDKNPGAKIIVLSTYKGDEDVYQALKAGAKAYLVKDSSRQELLECIRSVHDGQLKVSSTLALKLMPGIIGERLTAREHEILKEIATGKSNKEIGTTLGIAEGTVKIHAGRLCKKLGVAGRTEAVRVALERGLVHLPSL